MAHIVFPVILAGLTLISVYGIVSCVVNQHTGDDVESIAGAASGVLMLILIIVVIARF